MITHYQFIKSANYQIEYMLNPRLATRYAKSLFDLAQERSGLETVYNDMLVLQQITKGNRDFVALLRSPVINSGTKTKVMEAVTVGKISDLTALFNRLLVQKGREAVLPEIVTAFIDQYKKHKGVTTVRLTTAAPVSDDVKRRIVQQVQATSNMQQIDLVTKVDESLIGGFVLEAGDKLVNASIAYDLQQISKQFQNNDFIYKLR